MLIALLLLPLVAAQAETPIDFQRQVRPVLSDNCFQCHGPDSTTRMAGLRLDRKEDALEVRKNGAPLNPVNFYYNDLTPEEYTRMLEMSSQAGQSFD